VKVLKVGVVKQGRKLASRSLSERGRLRVSIGGDLVVGRTYEEPPMLVCCSLTSNSANHDSITSKLQNSRCL
jgi:hypothetical protein